MMTRSNRLLASAAAIIVAAVLPARPAHALFGVGDIVFDPSSYAQIMETVNQGKEQIKWASDIYGKASEQVQRLERFYNLFAHITDAGQLAQVLNAEFLHSPMLANAVQLEQAFNGQGFNTSLAQKIKAIADRASYYRPAGQDLNALGLRENAERNAAAVATAKDLYDSSQQRVSAMKELELAGITDDPKKVQDLQLRAAIEGVVTQAQTNQLGAANMMVEAQRRTAEQQTEEAWRFSVDAMRQQAQAAIEAAKGASNATR